MLSSNLFLRGGSHLFMFPAPEGLWGCLSSWFVPSTFSCKNLYYFSGFASVLVLFQVPLSLVVWCDGVSEGLYPFVYFVFLYHSDFFDPCHVLFSGLALYPCHSHTRFRLLIIYSCLNLVRKDPRCIKAFGFNSTLEVICFAPFVHNLVMFELIELSQFPVIKPEA